MSTADRRQRVAEKLPDDVQALLVTTPANVRYLTGFTGSNGQLLLSADSVFFTDGRYDEQSSKQVPDIARAVYSGTTKLHDLLAKALADRGISKIAIEASNLTVASRDKLAGELSGIDLVPTTDLVEKVRQIKDAAEIDVMRSAQRIAEASLTKCLREFGDGTEMDLALAIEWDMRKTGAEGTSFETIVAGGAHSALPHAAPRTRPIEMDGLLLIDMGAKVDGYCSDMTRTFLGPRAPSEIRKIFDIVVEALDAAIAAVKAGVRCADVDKAARDVITAAGHGDRFIHSTGHSVGLEIHESPAFGPASEDTLEAGMVMTVEPGIYLPGVGGVRVEDFLVVTDAGSENLTRLTRSPDFPR